MNDRITVFLDIVLPALLFLAVVLLLLALIIWVMSRLQARARRAASRRRLMSAAMPPEVRKMADELWLDTQPASWAESHLVDDLWHNCPELRPHLISLARQWEGVSPPPPVSQLVTRTSSGVPAFPGVSPSAFEPKERIPPAAWSFDPGYRMGMGSVARCMPDDGITSPAPDSSDA